MKNVNISLDCPICQKSGGFISTKVVICFFQKEEKLSIEYNFCCVEHLEEFLNSHRKDNKGTNGLHTSSSRCEVSL